MGEELILSVNAHWRRIQVFKEHESQLSTAIVSTVAKLATRGWLGGRRIPTRVGSDK
jgi:hypothetical protein